MPPPIPNPALNSAAADRSHEARLAVQLAKWLAPKSVWKAGIGNSVLQPLPVAPPGPSFHTTSE
jgi:hypothetical protein